MQTLIRIDRETHHEVQHRVSEASKQLKSIPELVLSEPLRSQRPSRIEKVFGSGRDFAAWIGLVPREELSNWRQTEAQADLETGDR